MDLADKYNARLKKFFILGHGRSGTNFLADLLSKDPQAVVHHEHYPQDIEYFPLGFTDRYSNLLDGYLERRFTDVIGNVGSTVQIYGEVNSLLRYHVEWMKKNLQPELIHLVRDGRDVVRSMYARDVYRHPNIFVPAYPANDDPFSREWKNLSRFEQLCWYWQHTNAYLAERITRVVRFEDVLRDYRSFQDGILRPTGLNISQEVWAREITVKKNTTLHTFNPLKYFSKSRSGRATEKIPHWTKWPKDLTTSFWRICGMEMERFGYPQKPDNS